MGTCHQPVHSMWHGAVASKQGHGAEKGSAGPWHECQRQGWRGRAPMGAGSEVPPEHGQGRGCSKGGGAQGAGAGQARSQISTQGS